jgi:hypothetical protein
MANKRETMIGQGVPAPGDGSPGGHRDAWMHGGFVVLRRIIGPLAAAVFAFPLAGGVLNHDLNDNNVNVLGLQVTNSPVTVGINAVAGVLSTIDDTVQKANTAGIGKQ